MAVPGFQPPTGINDEDALARAKAAIADPGGAEAANLSRQGFAVSDQTDPTALAGFIGRRNQGNTGGPPAPGTTPGGPPAAAPAPGQGRFTPGGLIVNQQRPTDILTTARETLGASAQARTDDPFLKSADFGGAIGALNQIPGAAQAQTNIGNRLFGLGLEGIEGARASQQQAVDLLTPFATGQDSVARQQAGLAQNRLQGDVLSQLASQRGGFDAGTQIAGLQLLGHGQAAIQEQAGVQAAQERRQAIGDLLAAQQRQEQLGLSGLSLASGTLQRGVEAGLAPVRTLADIENQRRAAFLEATLQGIQGNR